MNSSKFNLTFLLILFLLCACGQKDEPAEKPGKGTLSYKTVHLKKTHGVCNQPDTSCAQITIEYPEILSAPTEAAKDSLNRFINNIILKSAMSESIPGNMEKLMEQFIEEYKLFQQDFPDYHTGWSDEKKIAILYHNDAILSLSFSEYAYTGGAHGLSTVRYYNFDLQTGTQLYLANLFVPGYQDKLRSIGEAKFRRLKEVPAAQELGNAGFTFENEQFSLNDNFAITAAGIEFYYNQYEIAPYALGPTQLLLTYEELKEIIPGEGVLSKIRR